ncbi:chromodomain Y-like protein 2 [Genypterus blacodes]|uniref:chromodomain Y-like protein 2 n=1 Tax=Genypterus blacodes TaxID=154954 RepID=UPI003F765EEA
MASGELYEVERIVDKRRNKKGKWEYLIRWKGYGRREDTWEPEQHLLHCEEFIHRFNRLHAQQPHKSATQSSRSRPDARRKRSFCGPAGVRGGEVLLAASEGSGVAHKQRKVGVGGANTALEDSKSTAVTHRDLPPGAPHHVSPEREPQSGLQNGEAGPLESPRPPPRGDEELRDTEGPQYTSGAGSPPLPQLHMKRKLVEERGYVFDKRLRYNVRQSDNNCRFRDIVVRKEDGFTHVLLSSQTTDHNALTPEVMKEVCLALGKAASDDSKLLLLSSVGTAFCSGLDPSYLIGRLSTDRRKESSRIADAVRDFVLAFIHFKKPIVAAINGGALGLGASILPLCDVVWASERAWFQTPCAALHLTPSGCSSYTFPQILGVALANEMLFCGRKLTAQEACSRGLVSQVFWPNTFNQEVMLRVKEMASCSSVVLAESKCLVRSLVLSVLEEVNQRECEKLQQLWSSTAGLEALFSFLHSRAAQHGCEGP